MEFQPPSTVSQIPHVLKGFFFFIFIHLLFQDKMREFTYSGYENQETCNHLLNGETCKVTGIGNSMLPLLKSRQSVICEPITEETTLKKRDIVLCKVKGHHYLHLIHGIRNDNEYLIGNNRGRMNGWISRSQIYGKVVEKL